MFILRRITSNGKESNTYLGASYNHVRKSENPEEYEKTREVYLGPRVEGADAEIYGFIIYDNGKEIIPLRTRSSYFIMASNGQTFANITLR